MDEAASLPVGLSAGLTGRRDALVVSAVAVVAAGLALGLWTFTRARTDAAEQRLGRALGVPVVVGAADVDLSGALTLDDVRVGSLFAADRVEAGLALSSLLGGKLSPDEIRVTAPRLTVAVHDGTSDLEQLVDRARAARAARQPAQASAGERRLRRVVVEGGRLEVSLGEHGSLSAEGVELAPTDEGLRLVTGALDARLAVRGLDVRAHFAQVGVDLGAARLRPQRAALVGGQLTMTSAGVEPLTLDRVVVGLGTTAPGVVQLDGHHKLGPVRLRAGHDPTGVRFVELSTVRLPLGALAAVAPAWADLRQASLAGDLTVRGGQRLAVQGAVDVEGLVVDHPVLARTPVPLTGRVELDVQGGADGGRGTVALSTGALTARIEGELVLADGRPQRLTLDARLPELACADALAALPAPLRGPLDGLGLEGRIAAHLTVAIDWAHLHDLRIGGALDNGCVVLADGPAADVAVLARAGRHTLPDGSVRELAGGAPGFVALDDVPPHVAEAFVAGEDASYHAHDGFDPDQLRLSLIADLESGAIVRGGSTISQQLAKNLFLGRERTLARKLVEAVLAWRLEAVLDKQRLLEVYLNVIELGPGVYGIGPAAQAWFGRPASELTVAQAAFLAALTPAPMSLSRRIADSGGLDEATRERVQIILRSMRRNRLISEARREDAAREVRRMEVRAVPVPAP
jgi:hypothetical protein